jgi:trans-2,3-dihydro-3-hydroxyanthranilate isomerase
MDCTIVRVFTRDGAGGNHLGVIRCHLQPQLMQEIAADLGFSETIFIDTADPGLPNVRIFTPGAELPFAGHPLVGAAWVLGAETDRIRCGIGDVGVRHDGPVTWIDVPLYGSVEDPSGVDAFLRRAGFQAPVAVHRVGLPLEYVIGELADVEAVAGGQPSMVVLSEVFGTLVYARRGEVARARFFAPGSGVDEDPATGSAAVALAVALSAAGEPEGHLSINQGEEIGHPSRIELRWDTTTASIGGTVELDEVRSLSV